MLGDDQLVSSMNPERFQDIAPKLKNLKGNNDDDEWFDTNATIIRSLINLGKTPSVGVYDFNMKWIE